ETHAARHLEGAGHRVLDRNWRSGRRELDLVTLDGHTVVFVEVKTRRPGPQPGAEALAPRQRRHLRRAAEAWIHAHPGIGREFRFDLVVVETAPGRPPRIDHLPDAFFGDDAR
ncbi:MAG: YraN family protein, partial [Gemmatimonadota bacterium]